MGGVWCKADKGQPRSFSPKAPFNSTLARWTDHVRQAYRKPKPSRHRPPRPPQKPLRSNNRLTISHPQLVPEDSSDGWRTATLLVPDHAPVPPPRKKRKCARDLTRTAYSMDDLNCEAPLGATTVSLGAKSRSVAGLDLHSSPSTLTVTPVLEALAKRSKRQPDVDNNRGENKENVPKQQHQEEESSNDDFAAEDLPEEIIPIEHETLYNSRTILHSNLGYIDKLSAISEVSTVSTESGFDDRLDLCKSSELSGSVTSSDSATRDSGLNILAHIQSINRSSSPNHGNKEIREKTAISKSEWLQNILKQEPEPFFLSRDNSKDTVINTDTHTQSGNITTELSSTPVDPLNNTNQELKTSKTPPPSPASSTDPSKVDTNLHADCDKDTNHSVLLEILKSNKTSDDHFVDCNSELHKEESIFLKDTKTNIIYKSLSSDKLSDINDDDYLIPDCNNLLQLDVSPSKEDGVVSKSASRKETNCTSEVTNPVENSDSKSHLTDYFFQAPRLAISDDGLNTLSVEQDKSSPISSLQSKEAFVPVNNEVKAKQLPEEKTTEVINNELVVNGIKSDLAVCPVTDTHKTVSDSKESDKTTTKEHITKKDSINSSRRSSITDSLHEFENSIYDMLKESKKNRDSSDEEESLKITAKEVMK